MGELKEAVLFEYERISDTIMDFGYGANLKMVADIGMKDKDNHKKRVYEEYRYKNTTKYNNTDYLISASRNASFYLKIDYPSTQSNFAKNSIMIPPFAIIGLRNIINKFDSVLFDPYVVGKNGNVSLIEKESVTLVSNPTPNSKIEISHSIYTDKNNQLDYGVMLGFNEDFYITVRSVTIWKSFVYYMNTCDLYTWGSVLLAPYTTNIMGKAVSEMGGEYKSTSRYETEKIYKADPDDIAEIELRNSKPMNTKPLTKEGKIKSFFD